MQRAMLHFNKPENAPLVRKALRQIHREDLIGYGKNCLVPPEKAADRKTGRSRRNQRISRRSRKKGTG